MKKVFSILLTIHLEGVLSSRAKVATEIPFSIKKKELLNKFDSRFAKFKEGNDVVISGTVMHHNLQRQPCYKKTVISAEAVKYWISNEVPEKFRPQKSRKINEAIWRQSSINQRIEYYLGTIAEGHPFSWVALDE